ncbi:hypothetical protein NKOR_07125 [Candidatus Nitrosopumilus koreensis AR1]|uniref:Uncharacterized protein n=1 Tax=Candidatus Nitrosopumilus koreensis AR1 TaxID=1229908 RepID=K0B864_9ARCH|nr:hypothetical protein NKOR_07125 [Candidatus Nitrosopumilus koreensis AR1]
MNENLQNFKTDNREYPNMVIIEELRVCKNCGNVFSKKAGVSHISECPQCKGTSFEQIETNYEELN